jgi:C-terminal processing protease CtpA/Prc
LGVEVDNAPKGLLVTDVSRNGPAWRFGIEPGDYILDVMGYPVGYYEGQYYQLADTLNRMAQRDGWVNILIWNKRSEAEEAMWVQAERRREIQNRPPTPRPIQN